MQLSSLELSNIYVIYKPGNILLSMYTPICNGVYALHYLHDTQETNYNVHLHHRVKYIILQF